MTRQVAVGTLVPYARASLMASATRDTMGSAEAAGQEHPERAGGDDRTDVLLDTTLDVTQPTARHAAYMRRMRELHAAVLPMVHMLALLRTQTQGAYVHILWSIPVSRELDGQVVATAQGVVGVELTELGKRLHIACRSASLLN